VKSVGVGVAQFVSYSFLEELFGESTSLTVPTSGRRRRENETRERLGTMDTILLYMKQFCRRLVYAHDLNLPSRISNTACVRRALKYCSSSVKKLAFGHSQRGNYSSGYCTSGALFERVRLRLPLPKQHVRFRQQAHEQAIIRRRLFSAVDHPSFVASISGLHKKPDQHSFLQFSHP